MKYIVHRRFKGKAICGDVNLPAMTELEDVNGVLMYNGRPICGVVCENAYHYFARNDDGNGMLRGKLTRNIMKTLESADEKYQDRWDKVWDDEICQPYKRADYEDHWLWNYDFFGADIDVLQHIADLVGVKEGI
jgi:hypothetical protein